MKYKKTSLIGGVLILMYFLLGIYGLTSFEIYDNRSLIGKLSIPFLLFMGIFSLSYSFITLLNEDNYKLISTYFTGILFSLIVANFIFWGTLGNILLVNDLLNDTRKGETVDGVLLSVYQLGDKGEHYEAVVVIDSDTVTFAINKDKFEQYKDRHLFHETLRKGYMGIVYK